MDLARALTIFLCATYGFLMQMKANDNFAARAQGLFLAILTRSL
jgi:hypothetical protein